MASYVELAMVSYTSSVKAQVKVKDDIEKEKRQWKKVNSSWILRVVGSE